MNSLNIVSRLTSTPPPSPPRSRTNSLAPDHSQSIKQEEISQGAGTATNVKAEIKTEDEDDTLDEKTPLLDSTSGSHAANTAPRRSLLWQLPSRVTEAVVYSVKVLLTTLATPGRYVVACFYDDLGHFSAVMPLRRFRNLMFRKRRKQTAGVSSSAVQEKQALERRPSQARRKVQHRRSPSMESTASTTSAATSENESGADDSPSQHTRSKSSGTGHADGDSVGKKSSRVKLLDNEQAVRNRQKSRARTRAAANAEDVATVATALKSPSSAVGSSKLTRYPRAPAPPRPLVPRRQPSYSLSYALEAPRKTLIIDLDETLIHSMARGGRMSTGHMVEVRLGGPVSSSGIQIGPGVPILYYVHERPGCHEFLRKVSKWFNLIVFTASVQEYADPVIDWLERERKYFAGRYYRQHCTYRNGAYIKDLAQVEPDLSKVMILDNSPMSYIFHEDNAIPIEGWISDPTDNDLLHLIPMLEGLQYVTDVRALLALRHGQAQQA